MSLLRDPDFPGPADLGAFWQTVETYADDDSTVRFILTQPLAAFPDYAGIGILPVHVLGGIRAADLPGDAFNLAPVGTGRLQWVSSSKQLAYTSVQLRPSPLAYDPSRAVHLSAVEFRFYPNTNSAFSALSRSEIQAMGELTYAQLTSALPSQKLSIYSARKPSFGAILFNQAAPTRLPFFTDPLVRRALEMALDKRALVSQALPQQALPAESTLLPGLWAYNSNLTPAPFDVAGAAQQMDQTGWPVAGSVRSHDNIAMSFRLMVADNPVDRQIGQAVVQSWKGLGVDARLDVVSAEQLIKHLQTTSGDQGHDFDAALVEFGQGDQADPDPYAFWHETQINDGQNYGGFADRDVSELLETARKEPNGVRRVELYRTYQQLFIDRVPAIILYNPLYHYAVSCQVQGIQLLLFAAPSDRFQNMNEWRVLSPEQAAKACSG
jgi:peptide/nickel transport system substrate-binding protein